MRQLQATSHHWEEALKDLNPVECLSGGEGAIRLTTDQKNTTHPISVEVIHTEAAFDMFDGISYGK